MVVTIAVTPTTTTVTTTNVVTKTLGAPPSRIYTIIPKTFTIVLVASNPWQNGHQHHVSPLYCHTLD